MKRRAPLWQRLASVSLTVLLVTAVAACSTPPDPDTLRRGNGAEPQTLDPHKAEGVESANILRDLYEGLTSISADGHVVPGVARRWSVSADGRTYDFELRPDARWSNGDAVTAEDFVVGLRRSADPATGSNYSSILSPILNADAVTAGKLPPDRLAVEALAPTRLRIRLKEPTPYFLELLAHSATSPIHRPSLQRWGADFARPGRLIGDGAYRLVDWRIEDHVLLERNPYYWDRAHVAIKRVVYLPIEDASSELQRFRANNLDVTDTFAPAALPWVRAQLPGQFRIAPYLGCNYFGINVSVPPLRGNQRLREALDLVVDRRLITDKMRNTGQQPAYGIVPPGITGYVAQRPVWADWPFERRVALARQDYAAAGYSAAHPARFKILYNTSEENTKMVTVVAAMWKQYLGVEATLVNQEWKVFLQTRAQKTATQVFRAGWIGDYQDPDTFLGLFRSDNGMNDTGYANPQFDALLDRAEQETDAGRRAQLYEAAERIFEHDVPAIPLYFYVSMHLIKPWVLGWQDNLSDVHATKDLRLAPH
jgi:oligopeptide transport system substrate-binding protein